MLKAMGAVLMIAGSTAAGWAAASRYARRPGELQALIFALRTLEAEIAARGTPLPTALRVASQRTAGRVAGLLAEAAARLAGGEAPPAEAWEQALQAWLPASALLEEDLVVLRALGVSFGAPTATEQVRHLRLARSFLEHAWHTAVAERSVKVRLWAYGGLCAGTVAALLLA